MAQSAPGLDSRLHAVRSLNLSNLTITSILTAAMSSQQQQQRNPAALAQEYQSRRNELQNLLTKLGEVEADLEEHRSSI